MSAKSGSNNGAQTPPWLDDLATDHSLPVTRATTNAAQFSARRRPSNEQANARHGARSPNAYETVSTVLSFLGGRRLTVHLNLQQTILHVAVVNEQQQHVERHTSNRFDVAPADGDGQILAFAVAC